MTIGKSKVLNLSVFNKTSVEKQVSLNLKDLPSEYSVKGLPHGLLKISPHIKNNFPLILDASPGAASARFVAEITDADKSLGMQLGIIIK